MWNLEVFENCVVLKRVFNFGKVVNLKVLERDCLKNKNDWWWKSEIFRKMFLRKKMSHQENEGFKPNVGVNHKKYHNIGG